MVRTVFFDRDHREPPNCKPYIHGCCSVHRRDDRKQLMQAYILCGGQGTRLRSVTKNTQKTVVDIHGRPFLSLVLGQLRRAGITRATLCAGYRADQLAELLPEIAKNSGLDLDLIIETAPLGTGGAVLNGLRQTPPRERYLVVNADTFLDAEAYRQAIAARHDCLVAVRMTDRARFGSLECRDDGLVQQLQEKGVAGPGLINGGVYGFSATTLAELPIRPCSMEHDILPELIRRGQLFAVEYSGPFRDIGTPESLEAFKLETAQCKS